MAIFREISPEDVKTNKSFLNQLVDVINLDVSASSTRKKYEVFVTGGVGPGVTSSLFQTVFDQDFTLQTANPIFDVTFGFHSGSQAVLETNPTIDSNGKYLFGSNFIMMREKLDIYRLFASELLGDGDARFVAKYGSSEYNIDHPLFIAFKRLFARDQIKRETFAIRVNPSASYPVVGGNLLSVGSTTTKIYTDANSTTNKEYTFGGQVSTVVDSANTTFPVGLLFIDKGILVLDVSRSFDWGGPLSGVLDAVTTTGLQPNFTGSLKDLMVSASIDDCVDHICGTRFSGSSAGETAITFQNVTNINSTLFFCRMSADEFNYSSNPTYLDADGRIVVIDEGQEETQKSFTFITSVGLYDVFDNLLACGKISRPVLKDSERDLTIKLRLDY
jgi:hypothetical protein